MDIWSRLLGSAGGAQSNKHAASRSPQQRLIRFKKAHDQLQNIWRRNNATAKPAAPPDLVRQSLDGLLTSLRDEVQTPIPHLCARHVSTFNVFTTIAQVSSMYNDESIMRETLEIFKILLDSEEGDFVEKKAFADAVVGYISSLSAAGIEAKMEVQLVEVLFAIAARLRLEPETLPAWFKTEVVGSENGHRGHVEASREDFPLFYLIVDYVHHDGKVGDFARTGLLYIIECAGHSTALEQWIIESDLATLMASGLGALYSQLSRKLVLAFDKQNVPTIITFSECSEGLETKEAEETTSLAFKAHLATFLSHLIFWQDVLDHCSSTEVKQTLLDHFKFLFLQQLLYPSLIESSDVDGGSSVAVLTYLRCIIETISNPELTKIVFQYLLATPDMAMHDFQASRPTAMARRRKSDNLISTLAKGQDKPVPDLFNLLDLVLTSLRSRNQQTVIATLRLICILLRNRHQYDFFLFRTRLLDKGRPSRSNQIHEYNVQLLFEMAESLAGFDTLCDSYKSHIHDAQYAIESHDCSSSILFIPGASSRTPLSNVQPHALEECDALFQALVYRLKNFLANDIETNMALTQVLSTLALCGTLDLTPWLLSSDSDDRMTGLVDSTNGSSTPHEDGNLQPPKRGRAGYDRTRTPSAGSEHLRTTNFETRQAISPVFAALEEIIRQVNAVRGEILDFDVFLSERKHLFQMDEEVDEAVASDSPISRRSEDSNALVSNKMKSTPQVGSISQRLFSQQSSAQGSRASSPRGRQSDVVQTPGMAGRLSHLHIPPSPVSPASHTRAFSPSPLRKTTPVSKTPPRRVSTPMGPADVLRQKVRVRMGKTIDGSGPEIGHDMIDKSETDSVRSSSQGADAKEESDGSSMEVPLNLLLTNVIILQEFLLELAAIVQVRASLFGEVDPD